MRSVRCQRLVCLFLLFYYCRVNVVAVDVVVVDVVKVGVAVVLVVVIVALIVSCRAGRVSNYSEFRRSGCTE